jgi:hypothetical protein
MRATAALLAFSLLAAGCASHSPAKGPQPSARDAALADVLEAVFRYQIGQNASAGRYCLELAGTSPDASILRRFEGNQPPVLSVDQCKSQPGPSLYLRLTKIQWVVDDEAWVRGAVSDGSPPSPIVAYRVVREKGKKGKWTVQAAREHGL